MTPLYALQSNFIDTINQGPDALDHSAFVGPIERVLLGFKAHANTINHARLVALEESFPLTRQEMGDAAFNAQSRAYIETARARAADNNSIGRSFPEFLRAAAVDASLSDLAAVEWAWLESYHAPDAEPLALNALSGLSEAALLAFNVKTHPAARSVRLTAPLSSALAQVTALMPNPVSVLAVRPAVEVRLLPMDAVTTATFSTMEKSTSIGNLLALITEQHGIDDPLGPFLDMLNTGALIEP